MARPTIGEIEDEYWVSVYSDPYFWLAALVKFAVAIWLAYVAWSVGE